MSGNSAPSFNSGGGIYRYDPGGGTLNLNSSIVAKNTAGCAPDIDGTVSSGDYNLVENTSGTTLTGTHNITGVDPMLGPLASYGGPTAMHILLTGSPAIDQGKNFSGATTDQRGAGSERTVDGAAANATGGDGTDIGAFERQIGEIDPTPGGAGGVGGGGYSRGGGVVDVVAVDLMVAAEVAAAAVGTWWRTWWGTWWGTWWRTWWRTPKIK